MENAISNAQGPVVVTHKNSVAIHQRDNLKNVEKII